MKDHSMGVPQSANLARWDRQRSTVNGEVATTSPELVNLVGLGAGGQPVAS